VIILAVVERIKQISTITDLDYAEICSTYTTMTQPKYRCGDCKLKYKKDAAKTARNRELMACNYTTEKPRHSYIPDFNNKGNPTIFYNKCIGNYYNGYWGTLINYYSKYKDGIMLYEGSLADQPSKFVDVMNLIDNLIRENQADKERKEKLISRNRNGRR